ncbi:MAG TPA: tRNA (adenosine(37)-N6)-threonylcarbamoyltransferase complex transferase subunit TsaD [Firmicutes bacterium]|jgi:N6-L-threonylcarbamoyladenine synthase|nr:tRNA (adenosine(37)-N6)-threonylcarbamoyltransferase complex transferase subunit TsaD [Bacillota bacterium]HAZ20789.1 tRNA (adenosine(37)-N6)-threonylcarbamoyltransferase complex transferase subunit TsaD [Bacillota bacterium]HBE05894.1 tRNA (adenosine(37)-N6)-threonylcarbamoyltransferase complex transferase subunit TsaD [Bacillota bacterium]HBG43482.1 tRNA (adenosine(37)-N6)-threonylcarbamoyltransferase complex transferase subunit TsaD [Bacillota bacterium]HBL51028.1 tRNA (adenosine(37)-N6)-
MSTYTLGVETSCDETSAAIVQDGITILSNIIASQIDCHKPFGGVVPEIASRKHLANVLPVIQKALDTAGLTLSEIDQIAVTCGPGLVGALLVGVTTAKAIAYARKLPLIPVNHIEGHIFANMLGRDAVSTPFLCLTVSGGHTDLLLVHKSGEYLHLGGTRDDAAGESLDKVARVLGLGYPGGPAIEQAALAGDPSAFDFPAVLSGQKTYDFSFSGLKTAAINLINHYRQVGQEIPIANLAAAFQKAVVDQLIDRTDKALHEYSPAALLLSGGVAANGTLRQEIVRLAERCGIEYYIPERVLCTDNAAMIASAGYHRSQMPGFEAADLTLNAYPDLPISGLIRRR